MNYLLLLATTNLKSPWIDTDRKRWIQKDSGCDGYTNMDRGR